MTALKYEWLLNIYISGFFILASLALLMDNYEATEEMSDDDLHFFVIASITWPFTLVLFSLMYAIESAVKKIKEW